MLKLSINLDAQNPREIMTERNLKAGTIFPIVVMVEDDGKDPSPSIFDTLIVEILFNDLDPVLSVDPVQRPVAGELAGNSKTTTDAFSGEPIRPITFKELDGLFSGRDTSVPPHTQLMLKLPTVGNIGRYKNSTGHAGIADFGTPFELTPASGPISLALGKANAGMSAIAAGKTHIVAIGTALLGERPLEINSVVGIVSVI